MPARHDPATEQVNVFPFNNTMVFKYYFDGEEVFDELRTYYNSNKYRFEVPGEAYDSLRRFLLNHGYELSIVDRPEEYYVIVPQYSAHPDGIFKQSVHHEPVDDYHAFLMKDLSAVDVMVMRGAERLESKPLILRSESLTDYASPTA
jgi:hypothetical protein